MRMVTVVRGLFAPHPNRLGLYESISGIHKRVMKEQGLPTEFYLILFVVCVGVVIFLILWGVAQRLYRKYNRKYRRRRQRVS
jgi:hypothetical protein